MQKINQKYKWKLVYTKSDFAKNEAICPHGIGHHKGIHGCDGCCQKCPKKIWDKVTDDNLLTNNR